MRWNKKNEPLPSGTYLAFNASINSAQTFASDQLSKRLRPVGGSVSSANAQVAVGFARNRISRSRTARFICSVLVSAGHRQIVVHSPGMLLRNPLRQNLWREPAWSDWLMSATAHSAGAEQQRHYAKPDICRKPIRDRAAISKM